MIALFKRFVIGGRSGKREAAWFLVIVWILAAGWFAWQELSGHSLPGVLAMLQTSATGVLAFLAMAYGLEWHSTQSQWRDDAPPKYQDDFG